jgi:cyclic pyranopterin phosphate synthase
MVDIGSKTPGPRRALARARLSFPPGVLEQVLRLGGPKGPIEEVARLAGIQAAKRTADLIPLCHSLALDHVDVRFERQGPDQLLVLASAACRAATGVEMEAMTAAAVAALTVYDMVKGLTKDVRIEAVELLEKDGGRSGSYRSGTS